MEDHAGTANHFCSHVTWKTRNQDAHYFISYLYSITHKLILSARRMVNYHSIRYRLACVCPEYLYYKRRDPYLCSAKAPVLEGSGSRRLYRRKGTSVNRVYVVFGARVDLGFFLLFVKNGFVVGARTLNVTAGHWINTMLLARPHHCLTATPGYALHNRPSAAGQTTHTVCIVLDGGRHAGREGPGRSKEGWREGGRQQREDGGGRDGSRGGRRKRWC